MSLLKKVYHRLSVVLNNSSLFVKYLQKSVIIVGQDCVFRDPRSTRIDMTRPSLISIGNRVDMNVNFQIWTHDWASHVFIGMRKKMLNSSGRVTIGNNVYIAANVIILKGVSIGDNCVIGAGSLVTKDIPSNSVAVGNPCRVICSIDAYYKKRKELCLNEAVEYVNSYIDRYGKEPQEPDLGEEKIYFRGGGFPSCKDFIQYCKNKK